MPYVVNASGSESRTVSKDFDPNITSDLLRQLVGTRPFSKEGRVNIPKRLRVGRPARGGIPHILGWFHGPWIVSPRVHDIIEDLEPGVQEFVPIALVSKDGKRELATYFLVLLPPQLDAIISEETEFDTPDSLRPRGRCVLKADVIRGRHFWRGVHPLGLTYFASDELHDRLTAEKLDGWDLRHRCTVRPSEAIPV